MLSHITSGFYFWCINQNFIVRWGNELSEPFKVTNGVRQGGIGSPFYFNLYLDGLSNILNSCSSGCVINNCKTNHIFYADDSVLICPSPSALQHLLDICQEYASKFELVFNEKKTRIMCFKPKMFSDLYVPQFTLNGRSLQQVSSHKYLGVFIHEKLHDDDDISRQVKSVYSKGNILVRKFSKCSEDVKVRLFKAYCCSFYCDTLWSVFKKSSHRKLVTSYNTILRLLLNLDFKTSISGICVTLNFDSIKVLLRKRIFSFRQRILNCDNALVLAITKSVYFITSNINARWNEVLL